MIEKDEHKLTGRAKEREEMRIAAEAKRKAEAEQKCPKSYKIVPPLDKITTPWWHEFTPEEEELEKLRGPCEKPSGRKSLLLGRLRDIAKCFMYVFYC